MSAWRFEVIRFPSVAHKIALMLGVEPPPECRIDNGRITLTFRRISAARWPEAQQIEYAIRAARAARAACADDERSKVRKASEKYATVVVLEDKTIVEGCAVVARWECVVPARW